MCGAVLLGVNLLSYNLNITFNIIEKVAIAFLGIAFLISLSIRIDNKVLSFIGRRTLPIYVLHGIFIAATRIALGKMGLNDIWDRSVYYLYCSRCGCAAINIRNLCKMES